MLCRFCRQCKPAQICVFKEMIEYEAKYARGQYKEGKQDIINFHINITLRPVIKGKENTSETMHYRPPTQNNANKGH